MRKVNKFSENVPVPNAGGEPDTTGVAQAVVERRDVAAWLELTTANGTPIKVFGRRIPLPRLP